ncbi:hypothetical protein FZEAL_4379 [Fusarium zealandicum]|uniref:6-phosphofructo-2-kinase domain-containing protein n=1 Tax=Fusarium zealandicum TaxID=1053134 RepID=A0A8H4UMI6_9HYPO|nr:hypothetical protein FZEAL_4379 [Fusarium zealandicum]
MCRLAHHLVCHLELVKEGDDDQFPSAPQTTRQDLNKRKEGERGERLGELGALRGSDAHATKGDESTSAATPSKLGSMDGQQTLAEGTSATPKLGQRTLSSTPLRSWQPWVLGITGLFYLSSWSSNKPPATDHRPPHITSHHLVALLISLNNPSGPRQGNGDSQATDFEAATILPARREPSRRRKRGRPHRHPLHVTLFRPRRKQPYPATRSNHQSIDSPTTSLFDTTEGKGFDDEAPIFAQQFPNEEKSTRPLRPTAPAHHALPASRAVILVAGLDRPATDSPWLPPAVSDSSLAVTSRSGPGLGLRAESPLLLTQMPSAIPVTPADAGRKQSKQSALAKLVMHSLLGISPLSSPALPAASSSSAPKSAPESDQLPPTSDPSSNPANPNNYAVLPPPADDDHLPPPPPQGHHHPSSLAVALRAMNDLTETPTYARSVTSTAPSSPRIPPVRQNSGSQTPRVRPHATTLNIPGMTRSRVSPDGRIPHRDVAAKLVIIMVGLPARGKSYITKKLQRYLSWQQHDSRIFNVGNRRRVAAGRKVSVHPKLHPEPAHLDPPVHAASILLNGGPAPPLSPEQAEPDMLDLNESMFKDKSEMDQSATFFDPKNERAAAMREQCAMDTLDELMDYLLLHGGAVGILDATNSTIERRQNIVNRIKRREPKLGILFIESICQDPMLLEANMRLKLSGPDYRDKDPQQSLQDFKKRVSAYESAYVPLGNFEEQHDLQYIQMIDVGRKLVQHRLKGFLSNGISTYLASFNLSPRTIWITRHGQSVDNELGRLGGDSHLTEGGHLYGQALHRFITHQRQLWLMEQKSKMAQASFPPTPGDNTPPYPEMNRDLDDKNFCVWTSMLERSVDTAEYFEADEDYDVKNWEFLNEMNTGQFEGMTYAEIAKKEPEEYAKRSKDKLNYIYPGVGGEGYLQVVSRLRDMVREVERIEDHLLIIGHRSVCRVLMAYFMDQSLADITDMDIPLGMLYSIEPKPYGIAFHAFRYVEEQGWFEELPNYKPQKTARNSV